LYYAAAFLLDWQQHWLMRAKPNLRYEIVTTFAAGDWRVRLPVSQQARAQRLSFQWLTLAITMALTGWSLDDSETLPERLQALRKIAVRYLLPPRRPRSYPREVKQRSKSYPRKNASQLN